MPITLKFSIDFVDWFEKVWFDLISNDQIASSFKVDWIWGNDFAHAALIAYGKKGSK